MSERVAGTRAVGVVGGPIVDRQRPKASQQLARRQEPPPDRGAREQFSGAGGGNSGPGTDEPEVARQRRLLGFPRKTVSSQLPDRLAGGEDCDRPTGEVVELVMAVDAQMLVGGGEQVLRCQRTFPWIFSPAAGGADHLPQVQPAAADEGGTWPGDNDHGRVCR